MDQAKEVMTLATAWELYLPGIPVPENAVLERWAYYDNQSGLMLQAIEKASQYKSRVPLRNPVNYVWGTFGRLCERWQTEQAKDVN